MAYEIKVFPSIGANILKTVKDKVEVANYIKQYYTYNFWGDNFKVEVKKVPDLKK